MKGQKPRKKVLMEKEQKVPTHTAQVMEKALSDMRKHKSQLKTV